ncbi:fibrobacter succinogenes major paralogous domain-containing protein, partial [Dysgonomonas reticulitermitis]
RTIFDIAQGNDDYVNGKLVARAPYSTDFTKLDEIYEQDATAGTPVVTEPDPSGAWLYSGRQVYTFTASGNVSNVRFVYVEDASLKAIQSMTPKGNYSGIITAGTACKAVVVYKPELMTTLVNKTRDQAVQPDLYVIYNDAANGAGKDCAIRLTVSLQDCNCCGAFTTAGGWQNFLCYNLGANFMLDPFTYKSINNTTGNDIKGDLYQWGRVADGHEKRTSPNYLTDDNSDENEPVPDSDLDTNGLQVSSSSDAYRKFIKNGIIGTGTYRSDWRQTENDNLWGNGSADEDMDKVVANDPCPAGWKVPSQKQWASIYGSSTSPNIWTSNNGYKVGSSLFLPAAGYREVNGEPRYGGWSGHYWSSTVNGGSARYLYFYNGISGVLPAYTAPRVLGMSVRCVAETVPLAPETLPPGTGSFTGRNIFDIAKGLTNDGGACGILDARVPYSTDFTKIDEQDATDGMPVKIDPDPSGTWLYSGRQVYTFTPSAEVSNVRFTYVEDASAPFKSIISMTPKGNADYSGTITAGTACKAVVDYDPDLMTNLVNKTRDQAVKPKLYAIYNDAADGKDYAVQLTVSLQDCNCCG